tara:strand:- start:35204 stop:35884 length:681 start_codon:yes stop_codon:yes gene_type:complete
MLIQWKYTFVVNALISHGGFMKTTSRLLLLLLLLPQMALAEFHVEPYLGYAFESSSQQTSTTKYEWSSSYIEFGGRAGYEMLGLSLGVDYNLTPGGRDFEQDAPATTTQDKSEWKGHNFGLFVGYELPIMLRVYATYYLSSKLKVDSDKDGDATNDVGDEYSGNGFNLGVGFTGLPFVSINLEYRHNSYDELKDVASGVTTKYPNLGVQERKNNAVLLSVSLPLHL